MAPVQSADHDLFGDEREESNENGSWRVRYAHAGVEPRSNMNPS